MCDIDICEVGDCKEKSWEYFAKEMNLLVDKKKYMPSETRALHFMNVKNFIKNNKSMFTDDHIDKIVLFINFIVQTYIQQFNNEDWSFLKLNTFMLALHEIRDLYNHPKINDILSVSAESLARWEEEGGLQPF